MADNFKVQDGTGDGRSIDMRSTDLGGGVHVQHVRVQGYDPEDDMVKVKSIQKKFRDSFVRPVTDLWDVTTGGGATITNPAGVLTINTGTAPGAYAEMLSKEFFTIPFRGVVGIMLSARHAATHCMFEAVSVDPITGIPDGKHSIDIDIGGAATTTVTNMVYGTQSTGMRSLRSSAVAVLTSAAYSMLELEAFSDEAYFHSRAMDTTAGRANSYVRHQQIPDPSGVYKLRLRMFNCAAWQDTITNAVSGADGKIRITAAAHGRATGNVIWLEQLTGVLNGDQQVRGVYTLTVIDANTFELDDTTFSGAYQLGTGRFAVGTAATATNMLLQFVNCQDYAELTAEITAGRGQIVQGQAIGVAVVSTVAANCTITSAGSTIYTDSAANLGAGATFSGPSRDAGATNSFKDFAANAYSSHAGTLRVEKSTDGVTWRPAAIADVPADVPVTIVVPVTTRYQRVVFVNGPAAQTGFLLTSTLRKS